MAVTAVTLEIGNTAASLPHAGAGLPMNAQAFTPGTRRTVRAQDQLTECPRLAVPRRGHVLSTVVESYSDSTREGVAILSLALPEKKWVPAHAAVFASHNDDGGPSALLPDTSMAARAMVATWVTGIAVGAFHASATLLDAERWFLGAKATPRLSPLLAEQARQNAEALLRLNADPFAYRELLPYLLDPHGPGSRLSVRRDPSTRDARARKRNEGVFYTPVDVAEYMASACFDEFDSGPLPTVLEPACGTGVFLRTALREMKRRHPEHAVFYLASRCLYGVDIDPWALDASAFVLLAECWDKDSNLTPAEIWRRLRCNLAKADALLIDPPADYTTDQNMSGRTPLSELFPALEHGPNVVIGNPPYADLGPRADMAMLSRTFETLAVKPDVNAEIYLPFIEQMIRLADSACSGAFVLPLSIACNVGTQFSVMRNLIARTPGHWKFAFFDREPHALFGEDVKTRNAIVLWSRRTADRSANISTGPLRKWRGDSRAAMFKSLRFTPIDASIEIQSGIPKLEGELQSRALKVLFSRWNAGFKRGVHAIERINLSDTQAASTRVVFMGPTAYNFLSVFLRPDTNALPAGADISEHPLHCIRCSSDRDALAVFAIFSSHLAYWWWHMQGDGFHLSQRFIAEFPFGLQELPGSVIAALARCGEDLWARIRNFPIVSVNRGKTSLAFTPNGHDDIRRNIDQLLADVAGLKSSFVNELQQFTAHTVAATLRDGAFAENTE